MISCDDYHFFLLLENLLSNQLTNQAFHSPSSHLKMFEFESFFLRSFSETPLFLFNLPIFFCLFSHFISLAITFIFTWSFFYCNSSIQWCLCCAVCRWIFIFIFIMLLLLMMIMVLCVCFPLPVFLSLYIYGKDKFGHCICVCVCLFVWSILLLLLQIEHE